MENGDGTRYTWTFHAFGGAEPAFPDAAMWVVALPNCASLADAEVPPRSAGAGVQKEWPVSGTAGGRNQLP